MNLKRYTLYAVVGMLIFTNLSCNKNVPQNVFEIPFEDLRFTIPAGLSPFDIHYFVIRDLKVNKEFFYAQGQVKDPDKVRIIPASARMFNVLSNVDYEFIERISIQLFTEDLPNLNLEMYFRDPVHFKNGPVLNLIPTVVEIQDFLERDEFNLRIRVQLRYPPSEFVETQLQLVLRGEELQ